MGFKIYATLVVLWLCVVVVKVLQVTLEDAILALICVVMLERVLGIVERVTKS